MVTPLDQGDAMNGLHVPDDDDYDDLPDLVNVDDDWYTNRLDTITASDIATAVTRSYYEY